MGLISYKTKKPILVCKLSGFVVLSSLVMIGYFMRLPDKKAEIIVSCVLLGIFALGPYPVALELLVECTYPLDQVLIVSIPTVAKSREQYHQNIILLQWKLNCNTFLALRASEDIANQFLLMLDSINLYLG